MNTKTQILFEVDMTKTEIKDLVRDVLNTEFKNRLKDNKIPDEEKVKTIVKDLLKKHYKTLWTKSNYVIDDL